jgi:hypothetical protein
MRRLSILTLALIAACGANPGSGDGPAQRRDPNEISEAEIRASNQVNAYDLVVSLRPGWLLRPVAPTTVSNPEQDMVMVYLNGQRYGSLEQLRGLRAAEVARVRWYNSVAAQQRFGRATGGVVEVISRTGP